MSIVAFNGQIIEIFFRKPLDNTLILAYNVNVIKRKSRSPGIRAERKNMKKIINGKKYDTTTAKCMGEWTNNASRSDFNWCSEMLYRKRTGEFFLYGEGGPMTRYAHCYEDGNWGYGKDIIPLSYEDAQKLAEKHLDADEYEAIFGEVEE